MNQVGKPVYGNQLIGRNKELQLLKQLILAGQSIVIIVPRRMGKTSFQKKHPTHNSKSKRATQLTYVAFE